jgi:hypothetical protein
MVAWAWKNIFTIVLIHLEMYGFFYLFLLIMNKKKKKKKMRILGYACRRPNPNPKMLPRIKGVARPGAT